MNVAPFGFRDVVPCGVGATSRVFRAVHAGSGTTVALKRFHRQMIRTPEALARLKRELEALSQLRHPSIVGLLDVIRWGGDPTLVMRYVDGEDLKTRIDRSGPLPHAELDRLARALFDVLAAVHGAGIVHRDVKPQNVRLSASGEIFLLDFGSARLEAASQLTHTGTTVGTPEYMPPELFAGPVYDPRTDLYGAGATLFECATGRAPQTADSVAELAHRRSREPITPVAWVRKDLPLHLAQVIDRCLALYPEDRYPSAALAVWALDHPSLERVFQARRSNRPPCLHCGTPIAPESRLCASCKSDHPFQLAPGPCHVELEAVEDPARFLALTATLVPELARPAQLLALAEDTASLSFGKRRFASFLDREEAAELAARLGEAGVHARVAEEPKRPSAKLIGALFAVFALIAATTELFAPLGDTPWIAAFLFAAIYFFDRAAGVLRARSGVLADSRLPKSMWPALQLRAAGAAIAGAALAAMFGVEELEEATFRGAPLLALGSLAVLAAAASLARTGRRAHLDGSPEPRLLDQLAGAFFVKRPHALSVLDHPLAAGTKLSPALSAAFLAAFVALVPLELQTLSDLGIAICRDTGRAKALLVSYDGWGPFLFHPGKPGSASRVRSYNELFSDLIEPLPVEQEEVVAESSLTRVVRTAPRRELEGPPPLHLYAGALAGVSPLIFAGLLLWLLRRRASRIRRDGAKIFAELDLALFSTLAERSTPARHRTQLPARAAGAELAALHGRDRFTAEAIRRAADLAHHLSPGARERLRAAILAMAEEASGATEREDSLLARCIMETDRSHRARFELLALEGRLEAAAAALWAQQIRGGE